MERAIDRLVCVGQSQTVTMPSTGETSSDAGLVRAARSGDRAAFGELYQRFSRMVHGIILARVPRQVAEDLVHDVFLAALRQLHTLRDERAFPGWLAMIARNRARDHYRQTSEDAGMKVDVPDRNDPESEATDVLSVIQSLPLAYREPLILRLVEGMTGNEIAERTGLTPGSVRVNLHRGMRQLREKLGWGKLP